MQNPPFTYSPPLHHGDPYRHSASMGPLHPAQINLPPLRVDGQIQHHQAYSQAPQPHMPSPPLTGYYHPNSVLTHHGPPSMAHMGTGSAYVRYIPGPVTRVNKKEIKRRTKTGCMTCRRRRIKCDEQKPVCRNCVKSKRHCDGYVPLHKSPSRQQPSQSAGSNISNNNSSSSCYTPQPLSLHQQTTSQLHGLQTPQPQPVEHTQQPQQHPSPVSTPSISTSMSSPMASVSTGITTPSSTTSYCSSSASGPAPLVTAGYTNQSYSTAPNPHSYSPTALSHAYSTPPLTQSYSTSHISQSAYTLPSPISVSRHSPMASYYSSNATMEPIHAVSGGMKLPAMSNPMQGMRIC